MNIFVGILCAIALGLAIGGIINLASFLYKIKWISVRFSQLEQAEKYDAMMRRKLLKAAKQQARYEGRRGEKAVKREQQLLASYEKTYDVSFS